MITGTCYFVSFLTAIRYYKGQGLSKCDVQKKIRDREIYIGFPPVKTGENIVIVDNGTRYAIQRDEK